MLCEATFVYELCKLKNRGVEFSPNHLYFSFYEETSKSPTAKSQPSSIAFCLFLIIDSLVFCLDSHEVGILTDFTVVIS